MTNIRDFAFEVENAASDFESRGWKKVVVPFGTKAAKSPAWQNSDPKPEAFKKGPHNIGVQLGPKSGGLVDIDLDCPQARLLVDKFFPNLVDTAFGRFDPKTGLLTRGHRLVICKDIPAKEDKPHKFAFSKKDEAAAIEPLNFPKGVLLEVRAGNGYTGFPPSWYPIDDEKPGADHQLRWAFTGPSQMVPPIPEMAFAEVRRVAGLLAFASLCLAAYPGEGDRDNYCLKLAGALIHAGLEPAKADKFIVTIAEAANDDGWRDEKALRTKMKADEGDQVNGLPAFLEAYGLAACEKTVRKWLGMEAKTTEKTKPKRPVIDLLPTDIKLDGPKKVERVNSMTTLLLDKENQGGVYVRGDHLVRFTEGHKIVVVTPTWLAHRLQEVGGVFYRTDQYGMDYYTDCNEPAVMPLMATADQRPFRKLTGVVRMATLTRNDPGWDPATGLFGLFDKPCPVPLNPSREDAEREIDRLLDLVKLYPFKRMDHELEDPRPAHPFLEQNPKLPRATRSVWLSGMLSAAIRGDLDDCPVHVTDAPAFGSGKTKLAQMWGLIALGKLPDTSDWDTREEENKKGLVALLSSGTSFALFDNLESPIRGKTLANCITSPYFRSRILGYNDREMVVSTRALITFSGTNVTVASDMVRRTIVCRVDHGVENPEDLKFPFNPVKLVQDDLDGYRAACLTIMRAYVHAGCPGIGDLPPDGSFPTWRMVRGALVWLGQADPWDVQKVTRAMDPELEDKIQVFVALYTGPGLDHYFIPWEIEQCKFEDDGNVMQGMRCKDRLASRLSDGQWSNKAVGRLLSRYRDQVYAGLVLRRSYDGRYRLEGKPDAGFLELVEIMK